MSRVTLIYNDLRDQIARGSLRANDRIPSVAQLQEQYKVGFGTAYEAIKRLADERLVVREHGRGCYVNGESGLNVELHWFGSGDRPEQDYVKDVRARVEKLNLSRANVSASFTSRLVDVRNLPKPSDFAADCRDRGVRAILVASHGRDFLPYVQQLAEHIPLVSLFNAWGDQSVDCVSMDYTAAVADTLAVWRAQGAERIGMLASTLDNPNYHQIHDAIQTEAARQGLDFAANDIFVGNHDAALNWYIGRCHRPAAPRHWISPGDVYIRQILDAAALSPKCPADPSLLTFSLYQKSIDMLDGAARVGLVHLEAMIEKSCEILETRLCRPSELQGPITSLIPVEMFND